MEGNGDGFSLGKLVYGTSPRRTLLRAAVLAALCLIVFKFMFVPARVDGGSMAPTYSNHGLNLINRMAYLQNKPQRGDVVAIRLRETGHSIVLMKRVVGLPGEAIGFQNGRVTVDGQLLDEPYVQLPSDWERAPVVCGPDEYFVVGDNRSMLMDGHWFGRAKASLIAGKMVL
ncbi:MAG: signal peptidase I [Verrucomicrobia bacterium]|jgi:signal peptidase I|nr:signal peptidase I [Verrucomicrobiota bacterium]